METDEKGSIAEAAGEEERAVESVVREVLESQGFAMLATEGEGGQPHASLMAFASLADLRSLVFGTYRGTRKYGNLKSNPRVALLVDGRHLPEAVFGSAPVVTVVGEARELGGREREVAAGLLLARHPELASFVASPACALVRVEVGAYQVVRGLEDARWWRPGAQPGRKPGG